MLDPFLGKSQYAQHGQRVVEGQRMMQATPDIVLGWERIVAIDGEKKDFSIRQLWDAKSSGDRIAIAAYLGSGASFDRAMAELAETYADQNDRDYGALQEATASCRVRAEMGV